MPAYGAVRCLGQLMGRTVGSIYDDKQVNIAIRRRFTPRLRSEEVDRLRSKRCHQALDDPGKLRPMLSTERRNLLTDVLKESFSVHSVHCSVGGDDVRRGACGLPSLCRGTLHRTQRQHGETN